MIVLRVCMIIVVNDGTLSPSVYRCPKSTMETDDGQNTQTVMLCLLCGQLLCTNCYSCQESLPDDESVKIGQFTQHSQQ